MGFLVSKIYWGFKTTCPCRGAYWSFRYDGKARVECNEFERYYNCTSICESCLAQRRTKNSNPDLRYTDFRECSPRRLTQIDDATYRQTCKTISPYHCIPGWTLGTCFRDLLHVVYLGTAKDILPSLLADWLDHGLLGGPHMNVHDRLRLFSIEMHKVFRTERIQRWFSLLFFEICDLLILVLIDVALHWWIYPNFIPQTARVSKDWGAETVLHWTEHGSWQTFKVSDAGKGLERSTHKGLVVVLHSEICRVCSCKPRILQREQHMFQSVFRFSRGHSDLKQMNVPMFWEDT